MKKGIVKQIIAGRFYGYYRWKVIAWNNQTLLRSNFYDSYRVCLKTATKMAKQLGVDVVKEVVESFDERIWGDELFLRWLKDNGKGYVTSKNPHKGEAEIIQSGDLHRPRYINNQPVKSGEICGEIL